MPNSSVALLYHDIVDQEATETSGVVTDGSWRYKLSPELFREHLKTIERSPFSPRVLTADGVDRAVYLTFDDGGRTAVQAADLLEEFGFRGNFFIITERIGDRGYVTWGDIERLADAGHLIGSHTCTHANLLETDDMDRELRESKRVIEDRLGYCVALSMPKGTYNQDIFDAAWDAGYSYVLTSEPERIHRARAGRSIGRWNIWYDTGGTDLDKILRSEPRFYLRTVGRWKMLKACKRVVGRERFVAIRDSVFGSN
jgi:peptidoglycan/xylan/chitin deacetylase (PgdA/CDA1 family)